MFTAAPIPPDAPPHPETQAAEQETPARDRAATGAPSQHETPNPVRSEAPRSPADAGEAFPFPPRLPPGKRDRWTPYKRRRVLTTAFTPELVTEILETIERFGFT